MKRINAACIVRDLSFDTEKAREEYIEKQIALAERKHQPAPWYETHNSTDPAFPFDVLIGTAYNTNRMWDTTMNVKGE